MKLDDLYDQETPPPEELFAWKDDYSQQETQAQQRECECFQSWKRRLMEIEADEQEAG